MNVLPEWHSVFPKAEQIRAYETGVRYALLMEDADAFIEAHIAKEYSLERRRSLGAPDTSRNAIVSICRALSTPGHYGRQPVLFGSGAEDVSRALLDSSAWARKQHVQYLAVGLGACLTRYDRPEDLDRLVIEVVPPHHVWALSHPADATVPTAIYHLRVRSITDQRNQPIDVYAWDVWDITDPAQPSFRVLEALRDGVTGKDLTQAVLGIGALEGAAYPCRTPDGVPFLPYDVHRARDVGDMWNWQLGKGAFRGTLNAMLFGTYTNKIAKDATGLRYIVANMDIQGGRVVQNSDGTTTRILEIGPGEIVSGTSEPGQQPQVFPFGGGQELLNVAQFTANYASSLATDMGITPTDAVRVGANPMSGVAIHLTNSQKREEQHRQEPLCRAADVSMIRKVAALLDIAISEIGVVYHEIERSPDEERQSREADRELVAMGQLSPVDMYVRDHPGLTREQAIAALAQVGADRARIEAATSAMTGAKAADSALNGAQVTAAVDIVSRYHAGALSRDSAAAMLVQFFNLAPAVANAIVGTPGSVVAPVVAGAPAPMPVDVETDTESESDPDEPTDPADDVAEDAAEPDDTEPQ